MNGYEDTGHRVVSCSRCLLSSIQIVVGILLVSKEAEFLLAYKHANYTSPRIEAVFISALVECVNMGGGGNMHPS